MKYSVDQLIAEAGKLPPMPQAALKALALIRSPDSSAANLASVIGTDQVLTTHVLRWANSAFYGMESRIATVQQAIVVLGLDIVQELIMNYSLPEQTPARVYPAGRRTLASCAWHCHRREADLETIPSEDR